MSAAAIIDTDTDTAAERFSLLELDLPTMPAVVPPAPPAIPGKTILEPARAAAAAEREMIERLSGVEISGEGNGTFAGGGLVYDEGTMMLAEGVELALAGRAEWDRLPTAAVAATDHSAHVAAERRSDSRGVALSDFHVDRSGLLTRGLGRLRMTPSSFGQLRARADGAEIPANLNDWLGSSKKKATFRTRAPDHATRSRELYAVVSDKYAIIDGHDVLARAATELPPETRARVKYDAASTRLTADLTLANPYELEEEIGVGRLHRLGIRLRTRDDGRGALEIGVYAERIACINCTLLPVELAGLRRVHAGRREDIWGDVVEIVGCADSIMSEFSARWRDAHMARIVSESDGTMAGAAETFRRLIDGGWIGIDAKEETVVERLVDAWSYEPGCTLGAFLNAVTRSAHAGGWSDDVEDALEAQAGAMLYQQVRVLDLFA